MNNSFQRNRKVHLGNPVSKGIFLVILFVLMISSVSLKGQDPEFSQFYSNPLYLNPAFTGTSVLSRLAVNYRNQWPNRGNTFVTNYLSYDKFVTGMRGGIGFQAMYDVELNGIISNLNTSFLYAHHFKVNDRLFFSMALEAGVIYKQYKVSGLVFPGMINQNNGEIYGIYTLPTENGHKLVPDFSVGLVGQRDNVYFGFAINHLTRPDQSIVDGDAQGRLPLKITLHAGAKGHEFHHGLLSRAFTLSPNLIYQQQGSFRQINLGMYMKEDWLTFGLWYRNNLSMRPNSVVAMFGYQKEKFQFGYSFDYTLSNLAGYGYGSHEISLIFFFGQPRNQVFNRTMQIPQL